MDVQRIDQPIPARRTAWLDTPLSQWVTLDRALLVLGGILLLTVLSRFWDLGSRALHHDESLHAVYAYYLYDRGEYQHQPLMHGPVLFHLTALGYWLFGASDATARLVPALLGVVLAWLPWKLRPWLGRKGALAASAFILLSPTLLYYSRFIRHDIFAAVWTAVIVYGMWKYLEGGKTFHLGVMAAGWALLFSQKEVSFLFAFIFWSFLAVVLGLRVLGILGPKVAWRETREGHLLIAMAALFLPLATAVLLFAFNLHPGQVGGNSETSIYNYAQNWPMAASVRMYGIALVLFALGAVMAAALWSWRKFALLAAIFWTIFILFHTTFLTNFYGIGSGVIGSLGYWLEQQEVARGEQPWYYYAMLLPLYEFLPLLVGGVGTLAWLIRRDVEPIAPSPDAEVPHLNPRGLWPFFNLWWVTLTFVLLSVAGEKMPWLLVHLAFPLALLAGWALGRFLDRVPWERVLSREGLGFAVLLALTVFAFGSLLWMILKGQLPFRSTDAVGLKATTRWLVTLLVMGAAGWSAAAVAERIGGRAALAAATLTATLVLALLTVRYAVIASFINGDRAQEPLIFVQSSPSVTMVADDIAAISERMTGGKELRVAYDSFTSWPFDWYLRDYPNRFFYGSTPQSYADAIRDASVVLVGHPNEEALKPLVAGYVRHEYPLRWWFPEEYKDLTQVYTVAPDPNDPARVLMTPTGAQDESLGNVLRNVRLFAQQPGYVQDFWDFVKDREVKQPLGGENFAVYVKPEVAAQVWGYGTDLAAGVATPAEEAAPASEAAAPPAAPADFSAITEVRPADAVVAADFLAPKDVAVLPDGTLAVADSGNHRIRLVSPEGTVVGGFGTFGEAPGQFNEPWGIAAAPDGTLYVADTWNHRIQHLDTDGTVLHVWGSFTDTQGQLTAPGSFWGPRGVAVDSAGRVYVTDTGNKRVQVFEADGTFVDQFGGIGSGPGQLNEPVGIAISPDETIWVADTWNQRVQRFSPDGEPLQQVAVGTWANAPQSAVAKPGVAASADRVWISDPESHRIIEFDAAGRPVRAWGQPGSDASSLTFPLGLTFDEGRLWVADSENSRLLGFDVE